MITDLSWACDHGCCIGVIDTDIQPPGHRMAEIVVRPMYQVIRDLDCDERDDHKYCYRREAFAQTQGDYAHVDAHKDIPIDVGRGIYGTRNDTSTPLDLRTESTQATRTKPPLPRGTQIPEPARTTTRTKQTR